MTGLRHHLVGTALALLGAAALHAQDPISIADAKQQQFETTVTKVAGRVTVAGQFRNTAFIQDRTAGIAVFNNNFRIGVRIGDSVVIERAILREFGQSTGQPGTGLTQLAGDSLRFTVIPVERIDPTPRNVTIPNILESVEGQLVRVRRVRFIQTGSFQGETTYQVTDQFGNFLDVRLDAATEVAINQLPIPEGDVDLIGAISQFRGTYQLQPRFATDIGLPPIVIDTVSRSRTLDLSTWNLDWYGSADTLRGPRDKNRQRRSIRQVMDSVRSDIYALQEVLTQDALNALSDSIAGSYGSFLATDITSDQKLAYIYNRDVVTPVSRGLAVNGGAQAWANGRFPYRLTFEAKVEGKTHRLIVFNIHGKATDSTTAQQDYDRRKVDAETFHAYLRDFYHDSLVIVMGDFNDEIINTVIDDTKRTPYAVFVDDSTNWFIPTYALAERGLSSYVGGRRSFLDNIMVSNEVKPYVHRTYLETPSAYLSSYSSTVTDHLPVTMRVFTGNIPVSVQEDIAATGLRVSPNPMSDHGMVEVSMENGGRLSASLIDGMGNVVMELANETVAPSIRLLQIPVTTLASGSYMLRVSVNGTVRTQPVVIVH